MLKSIRPRIVELGKIKIGKKEDKVRKTQGGREWRAPEKLDHFLITTLQRTDKGDLVEDRGLMDQLLRMQPGGGEKLREIPVELLSDEIDDVLVASHCYYGSKKIWGTCDEETCTWFVDSQGNALKEPVKKPCNGEHAVKPEQGKPGWKTHATLNCIINAGPSSTVGGVYRFRTTSRITLEQLYGGLVHIQQLTRGVLQGLPLRLVVRPMQVNPEVNGKTQTTTVYVVHVELRGQDLAAIQHHAAQLTQVRVANAKQIEAARAEYRLMLRAPGESESPEEQEEVAEEFAPDAPPDLEPAASEAPAIPAELAGPKSEIDPATVYEQSQAVAAEAPQDRQLQDEHRVPTADDFGPPPVADPPAPKSDPLQEAIRLVESAKNNHDLNAAFLIIKDLPRGESKAARDAYNAKLKQLNPKNGARAHA